MLHFLLIGLVAPVVTAPGASMDMPVERFDQPWRISSFAADAGLSGHGVETIAFQADGTAWVATTAGLLRFDGYQWTRFGTNDGLPSMFISAVLVTRQDELWVGTDKGAGTFDGRTYNSRGSESQLAGPSVRRMAEDPDGTLWFCSHFWPDQVLKAGLTSYKEGSWTVYRTSEGLPHDHVLDYFQSSDGQQFAVTSGGVAQRKGRRWLSLIPALLITEGLWCVASTPEQGLLIPCGLNQLYLYRSNQFQLVSFNAEYPKQSILSLLTTRRGELLTCLTDGTGTRVHRWNGTNFLAVSAYLDSDDSLPNAVSLAEAPDGAIWACGRGALVRWSRSVSEWSEYLGLPPPRTVSEEGEVIFEGPSGLLALRGEEFVPVQDYQVGILNDQRGNSWTMPSSGDEIRQLKNGRLVAVFGSNQTGLVKVENAFRDGLGRTWCMGRDAQTRNAVAMFDGHIWRLVSLPGFQGKRFLLPPESDTRWVNDTSGGTWFLLSGDGAHRSGTDLFAARLEEQNLQLFALKTGGMGAWLRDILVTPDDEVWVFGQAGMFHLDRQSGQWSEVEAVRGRTVGRSLSRPGETWFTLFAFKEGAESGICRYRRGEWRFFPAALSAGVEQAWQALDGTLYFPANQGLLFVPPVPEAAPVPLSLRQFRGRPVAQLVKDPRGSLWLNLADAQGGKVVRYRPDRVPPRTRILDANAKVREDNRFLVRAVGIERFVPLSNPKTFRFSWRFDGSEWTGFQNLPEEGLPMTGLRPGSHRFEIRAQDEGLDVDPLPATLAFTVVSRPLQERAWFRPAVAGAFLLILFLAVLATERALRFAQANVALGKAHEELREINESLERRIEERTAQLQEQINERQKAKIQFSAVMAERNRLAAEIHDSLEQGLAGVALQLEAAERHSGKSPETARQHVELARSLVHQSQAEVRRSIWDMRSQLLETRDLAAAFSSIGKRMTEATPVRLEVAVQGNSRVLPELLEHQLFRLGQEAITNALKHAQATTISVVLTYEADSIRLTVRDDGLGFDPAGALSAESGRFGLVGMRERAMRLHGQFTLESAPGQGTKVVVQAPIPAPAMT